MLWRWNQFNPLTLTHSGLYLVGRGSIVDIVACDSILVRVHVAEVSNAIQMDISFREDNITRLC